MWRKRQWWANRLILFISKMGKLEIINYFWEELNAFTLNHHRFNDGFKELVNSSITRALIRDRNKGKTIAQILIEKKTKKDNKQ